LYLQSLCCSIEMRVNYDIQKVNMATCPICENAYGFLEHLYVSFSGNISHVQFLLVKQELLP